MRRSIFLCFLLSLFFVFASPAVEAQSLVFDGLVYFQFGGTQTGATSPVYYYDTTVTVPANRVWKITAIHISASDTSYYTPVGILNGYTITYGSSVWLDGVAIRINPTSTSSGGNSLPFQTLWIPAGVHSIRLRVPNVGGPREHHALINGIQFDVQ